MTDTTKLPESVISRFNEWRESGQSYKDPRDFVEGWHKDRLFWFIAEELAKARAEVLTTMIERVEKQKWNYYMAKDMDRKYVLALDDAIYLLREELTKKD